MAEPFDIEKYRSISVIRPRTRAVNRADGQLAKDMDAYSRLRSDGQQPAQIQGCAELEQRAEMKIELEMGKVFDKADRPHVEEGIRISEQLGMRGPYDR